MRRSKPRVVWLPPDPSNRSGFEGSQIQDPTANSNGTTGINLTGALVAGSQAGKAIAVVGDFGNAQDYVIGLNGALGTAPASFADLFSSGYRLRRICGAISCCLLQATDAQGGTGLRGSVAVTAAFQVMRVDSSGLPVDTQAANTDAYNTQENPWIWRRTWWLTNFASSLGQLLPVGSSNNFGGGSLREGQFVDQKTARVVGPDQRLFMCLTATVLVDQAAELNADVVFNWNLRVLASLKTNIGNRRNASR